MKLRLVCGLRCHGSIYLTRDNPDLHLTSTASVSDALCLNVPVIIMYNTAPILPYAYFNSS